MNLVDSLAKMLTTKVLFTGKKQLAEPTFQLTLQGEALTNLRYTPGERQ